MKFNDKYLDTEFIGNLNSGKRDFLNKAGGNVYYGKILNNIFCNLVMQKIKSFELFEYEQLTEQANSMHKNAILLEDLGLDDFFKEFFREILIKVIHSIFPERINQEFDGIHGYIVRYGDSKDKNLAFHVDDSLVTMNLCLNEEFSGSDLIFHGVRCPMHLDTPSMPEEEVVINHQKGFTVIHGGKNRHYVNSIIDGNRYGLILWCQNSKERDAWFDALEDNKCTEFCDYKK